MGGSRRIIAATAAISQLESVQVLREPRCEGTSHGSGGRTIPLPFYLLRQLLPASKYRVCTFLGDSSRVKSSTRLLPLAPPPFLLCVFFV